MNIHIPIINETFKLVEDWSFNIELQTINQPIIKHFYSKKNSNYNITLKKDSILYVVRYKVEKYTGELLITFKLIDIDGVKFNKCFCVNIKEVNNIIFEKQKIHKDTVRWKRSYNNSLNRGLPNFVLRVFNNIGTYSNIKPYLKIGNDFSIKINKIDVEYIKENIKENTLFNYKCLFTCEYANEKYKIIGEYIIRYNSITMSGELSNYSYNNDLNMTFISKKWSIYTENDTFIKDGSSFNTLKGQIKTDAELRKDKIKSLIKNIK